MMMWWMETGMVHVVNENLLVNCDAINCDAIINTIAVHVHYDVVTDWSYVLSPDFLFPRFLVWCFPVPRPILAIFYIAFYPDSLSFQYRTMFNK